MCIQYLCIFIMDGTLRSKLRSAAHRCGSTQCYAVVNCGALRRGASRNVLRSGAAISGGTLRSYAMNALTRIYAERSTAMNAPVARDGGAEAEEGADRAQARLE